MPCVWDCSGKGPAGRAPLQLEAHTDRLTALAFQHCSPLLASGGADCLVALWQLGKKEPVFQEYLPSPVTQLAWPSDDRLLAAGTENGTIVVWTVG